MRRSAAMLGVLISCGIAARAQPVQGDLKSVGFEAATATRHVIREGCWFPILCHLNKPGTEHFQGRLSVEFEDLDGDRVEFVEAPVTVTGGGDMKRVWCYASTPYRNAIAEVKVAIYDDQGNPIPAGSRLEKSVELISSDTMLILDLSESPTIPTRYDAGSNMYLTMNWGQRNYYRPICLARLPARELPDRWLGLEGCDVVIWDDPNPDETNPDQLAALVQWVRNGGQLVIGVGPSWSKVFKSALADILPIRGERPPNPTLRLSSFARLRLGDKPSFENPVVLAPSDLVPGALAPVADILPDGTVTNLVSLRHVGSGRVIALPARIRDLTAGGAKPEFYASLLDVNPHTEAFKKNEAESHELRLRASAAVELAPRLLEPIEFRRTASLLLFGAFAFVAVYILLSTLVAWLWLRRESLTHLAWSVFAGFAVVGGLASLGAVGTLQGCNDRVASVSLLDLEAGSVDARGRVLFGYKRTVRDNVDVSLPGDANFIRPLTPAADILSSYATPERYRALAGKSLLEQVPLRATLKQFEAFWSGPVSGPIRTSLVLDRATGRVTPDSWIQNDMDHELLGGYLLYIDPRLQDLIRGDGVPYRIAGREVRGREGEVVLKYLGSERVPAATHVLAVRLGPLAPGTKTTGLGRAEYEFHDRELAKWTIPSPRDRDPRTEPVLPTLWTHQIFDWIDGASGALLGRPVNATDANWSAFLLASTRNLYLHTRKDADFDQVGLPITTDGLPNVDVTHWLTRGSAVLLLLSNRPGPATLHADGEPIPTRDGRTLYRVRVPVTYTGSPPRATESRGPDRLPGEAP